MLYIHLLYLGSTSLSEENSFDLLTYTTKNSITHWGIGKPHLQFCLLPSFFSPVWKLNIFCKEYSANDYLQFCPSCGFFLHGSNKGVEEAALTGLKYRWVWLLWKRDAQYVSPFFPDLRGVTAWPHQYQGCFPYWMDLSRGLGRGGSWVGWLMVGVLVFLWVWGFFVCVCFFNL